ncbi:MAG: flagellar biosynthesis protein FlhF [Lachnospiraceae bacterium]|nr:flagellar biosynthesis protein FlhF [Lachnospiraceae bacterium]
MIIKRFTAKTEEEALAEAKKELGESLVVMSVKKTRRKGFFGLFSKKITELTAAVEDEQEISRNKAEAQKKSESDIREALSAINKVVQADNKSPGTSGKGSAASPAPAATATPKKAVSVMNEKDDKAQSTEAIEEKLDQLQNLLKSRFSEDGTESGGKEGQENKKDPDNKTDSEMEKFIDILRSTLIDSEIDGSYVDQAVCELRKSMKPGTDVDHALEQIYQKLILRLGGPALLRTSEKGPRVLFFVGPTGVGKTTTIAKIASRMMIEQKRKVALLTADTYRIAAVEQLRTYADILGVPFRVVYTPEEVKDTVASFKDFDFILVDTAGHSIKNEEQKNAMNAIIHAVDSDYDTQVYLVLSVTAKYKDQVKTADVYSDLTKYNLIFTKLDESDFIGCIYNLHVHTGADVAFVTDGQNVPDDIDVFDPQKTVKKLLGGED